MSTRTAAARRSDRHWQMVRTAGTQRRTHLSPTATLIRADARAWLQTLPPCSIHAVVTDPPYGLIEYAARDHRKLRAGRGGVWRIPPAFDGARRQPLPRFTVLSPVELAALSEFFTVLGSALHRVLVPGAHVFVASNPLLSTLTFHALQQAGLEKRGEVVRLVQTLRGGDRPKGAEAQFPDVSVMARSGWEPWGMFRKPLEGTVAQNLKRWGTGGLRRISAAQPFKDVIVSAPTVRAERGLAPHPSLKPQAFLRQLVRAALPLGVGIVYDPFAGSGSTLAAAQALGYHAVGTERDAKYFRMGCKAFAKLAALQSAKPTADLKRSIRFLNRPPSSFGTGDSLHPYRISQSGRKIDCVPRTENRNWRTYVKYLPLVWSALIRKPGETLLTLLAITTAFLAPVRDDRHESHGSAAGSACADGPPVDIATIRTRRLDYSRPAGGIARTTRAHRRRERGRARALVLSGYHADPHDPVGIVLMDEGHAAGVVGRVDHLGAVGSAVFDAIWNSGKRQGGQRNGA